MYPGNQKLFRNQGNHRILSPRMGKREGGREGGKFSNPLNPGYWWRDPNLSGRSRFEGVSATPLRAACLLVQGVLGDFRQREERLSALFRERNPSSHIERLVSSSCIINESPVGFCP